VVTIRERVAEFDALTKAHPDERYLCMGVTADRHDLLAAGDVLAEAVAAYRSSGPDFHVQPCPCWAHVALAAWKAATG
jgi:hypothetical protein